MKQDDEPRYTSRQLREAAAGEVINCMGWAMDCGNSEVYEWGRTLALRLPMILDAAEDPKPPHPEQLAALLEAGRQKYQELQQQGRLPIIPRAQ